MDVDNDFLRVFHVFSCWKQYLDFTWMLWIIMTSLSCIWLLETIFWFYMDVVDNNDFLFLDCWKHYLHFTWMLWIIMTSFSCIWLWKTIFRFYLNVVDKNDFLRVFHVFDCWKQYLDITWMLLIIMTSLMFSCIWLLETIFWFYIDVVDNTDFLYAFHLFGSWKQYLDFTWM